MDAVRFACNGALGTRYFPSKPGLQACQCSSAVCRIGVTFLYAQRNAIEVTIPVVAYISVESDDSKIRNLNQEAGKS
jgi:hypothetical protein